MSSQINSISLLVLALVTTNCFAQQTDFEEIKCFVDGTKTINREMFVEHHHGKVYFADEASVNSFKENKEKYVVFANHQLVLTGQFEQKGCPFSGDHTMEDAKADIGGVSVNFCCGSCQGLVDDETELAAKATAVFAPEAFAKGFRPSPTMAIADLKCFIMPKKTVKEKYAVEHNGGTVWLCCKSCVRRVEKKPERYEAGCNHQMVVTGQFAQTNCPISGGELDESVSMEIGGATVHFSDAASMKTVQDAGDDKARIELVFATEKFNKSFTAN